MIRRLSWAWSLRARLVVGCAVPVSAQLFGVSSTRPNYGQCAPALCRNCSGNYAQLVTTYQQIRTQYLLLQQQAQLLPVEHDAPGTAVCASPWLAVHARRARAARPTPLDH